MIRNIIAAGICGAFIVSATIPELKGHKQLDQLLMAVVFGFMAVLIK